MVKLITDHIDIWTSAQRQKTNGVGRGNASANQSPHGIKKLRELILELAVRGKLVPQDPKDEPASVLLEKIAKEKARLIKSVEIKKEKQLPEIGEDEKPVGLPFGWAIERLHKASWLITKGATPTTYGYQYTESGVCFVKVENIENNRIITDRNCQYIDEDAHNYLERSKLEDGDLLFSIAGTIGKTCIVHKEDLPANTNQALAIIRGTSTVFVPKFLLLQLDSFVSNKIKEKARGGAMYNVSLGDLNELILYIPPLAEQQRIVAKVDELMALCDQLEQQQSDSNIVHQTLVETLLTTLTTAADQDELAGAWKRIAEHFDTLFITEQSIDKLKQTSLQLAVMGKLVHQDPSDEPASVLLEKIANEKARLIKEGKIKKQEPLPEISDDEKPFDLPEGWEWARLGDITLINPRNEASDDSPASFVPMSLITTSHTGDHGQEERVWESIKQGFTHFANGDIGLAKITPCFENSKAVVFSNLINGIGAGTTELHITRPIGGTLCARYVLLYLKAPQFLLLGETKMTGTAGQKRVPKDFFAKNPFPLPPLIEQLRIVAKVDELIAICDALKARINDAQATQNQLADAIIEQAGKDGCNH